jgi:phospholipase/carboxylesterase
MDRLLILLHGVGAHGSSIRWMADHLGLFPSVAIEAPDAPDRFDQSPAGPGRQWFSVTGVTPQNRAVRIAAARDGFDATLRGIVQRHGLTHDLGRVALLGFSQGSIMALDAVATGRWPVGLVLAFSGRLGTPAPHLPLNMPVLIAHGSADPVIPVAEAATAHQALAGSELVIDQGVGHAPGPLGVAAAARLATTWAQPATV